jgi:hypothetical protein
MKLLVILGAALAASAAWLIAHGVGAQLAVHQGDAVQPVGLPAVIVVSLIVGLLGWALLAVLTRTLRRGRLVWTIVASGVFLVSLLGPLSGVDGATMGWLALMHTAVAAIVIIGLRAVTVPSQSPTPAR